MTDASIGHASVPCLDDDEDTVRVRFVADVPGVCGPSPRAQAVIDFARNVAWPAVAPAHDG